MPRGSAHRGIMTHTHTQHDYCMPRGSAHRGIISNETIESTSVWSTDRTIHYLVFQRTHCKEQDFYGL